MQMFPCCDAKSKFTSPYISHLSSRLTVPATFTAPLLFRTRKTSLSPSPCRNVYLSPPFTNLYSSKCGVVKMGDFAGFSNSSRWITKEGWKNTGLWSDSGPSVKGLFGWKWKKRGKESEGLLNYASSDKEEVTVETVDNSASFAEEDNQTTSSAIRASSGYVDIPGKMARAMLEPICPSTPQNPNKSLFNSDFAPTMPEGRIFSVLDMACLWVGLVVGVPTYYMAGSLVELGMAWWQGIATVFIANLVVLIPMILSGHAGTKYGVPFPVLARASFGIRGASVPALLRALVGCGWFGIQTWIGGNAIYQLLNTLAKGGFVGPVISWLGISASEFGCFMIFWLLQVGIIWNGIESIRELEKYCAPILIVLSGALLAWAYVAAGGFGPMLSTPSQFVPGGPKAGQFWQTFFPALTANVGFWATLSLNIPDFTRYSKSQGDQLTGQAIGLPLFMAAFTFVGLAVTSATVVIFGRAISDPIEVLGLIGGFFPILLSLVGVILATLTTNIAANIVAPANAFVNLNPVIFSFRGGGLLTAILGILLAPWRLIQSSQGFIFTWLIGYSALLGPVGGIMLVEYFAVRRRTLDIGALYSMDESGPYWYTKGFNVSAVLALIAGIAPNIPGFLLAAGQVQRIPRVLAALYDNSWFVGFFVAGLLYWFLSKQRRQSLNLG